MIIVTPNGDILKGTGRCIETLDLFAMLRKHEELFLRFGGHRGACGFQMKRENLPVLRRALQEDMEKLPLQQRIEPIPWEMDLTDQMVDLTVAEQLEEMEPFGKGNPRPLFRWRQALTSQVQIMGKSGEHLRFQMETGTGKLPCVFFGGAVGYRALLMNGVPVDVYGELSVNRWNGRTDLQVLVRDAAQSVDGGKDM